MAERAIFLAAVFMVVRDSDGRVLLHKRANTGYMDGFYDFPSGHVDEGESFAEAAVRELMEEAGLQTTQKDLKLTHLTQNFINTPYINAMFDIQSWTGEPTIMEPDKCDDMRFFAMDELPEKCTLGVRCFQKFSIDEQATFSKITRNEFEQLTGVSFDSIKQQ